MRTPAGFECKYFYGNYYRGKSDEECRLLGSAGGWNAGLCKTCPVPGIQRANACESLQLRGSVGRPLSAAFMRRVTVQAYCTRSRKSVSEPQIGCGECHPISEIFGTKK